MMNGEEGELLLQVLAKLTAAHKEGLESIVEVSVTKIEAEDEQEDYPQLSPSVRTLTSLSARSRHGTKLSGG